MLIYAIDLNSPHHRPAKRFLEKLLSGTERVGLPWIVVLAFLRVTTNSRAMQRPIDPERALAFVDSWLHQPTRNLLARAQTIGRF